MDLISVEKKWQKKWEEENLYAFDKKNVDRKKYILEMFSYPSGAKLHVGHWYNYGPSDSYARFQKMKGYEVFEPMGFDAFGLPAENYAIKNHVHPEDSTLKNIDTMEKQLKAMGGMFDWDAEVKTCMPDYYKWTQWIFLKLLEKGLAYRKEAPVNWCPSCNTVLANEQVQEGACERCGSAVVKKNLTQWFFKITEYAEELLQKLDGLDWPEKTKAMQRNWIGKSVGGEVEFTLDSGKSFRVFTTRADTLFGVSYVVLAPEHPLVKELTTPGQKKAVESYCAECAKSSEIDRLSTTREKTGVFTGSYALNPINGKKVPVWIADYVLYSYGTGAVMGVPAHDERDYAFASKYKLPIERVIQGKDGKDELPYCEYGTTVNSGKFSGLESKDAIDRILSALETQNKGCKKINYRLRDWLVSRQRYWGCPIPVVHCGHCGIVPVPEKQLPVTLPHDVKFAPDGKSPLAKHEGYMHTTCPKCGKPALRDPDTLDTFVCSSWYYLRYPDSKNQTMAFDPAIINKMLPVDKYIGGAEHACMHLLYARFFTKALRDMGYLDFDEPFTSLVHQGTILGPDGNKMSKSRGNVISPDDWIKQYGADVFRMYLMFGFSYTEGGPWNSDGIKSIAKFLDRVERIVTKYSGGKSVKQAGKEEASLNFTLHSSIKSINADMEVFSFNTAVARMMELVNAMYKYEADGGKNAGFMRYCGEQLVLLMAPFTPHFSEELWEILGHATSVFKASYPIHDESALVQDEIEYAVQINSKIRGRINIPGDLDSAEIEKFAACHADVKKWLEGNTVKKMIIIPKRLINILI